MAILLARVVLIAALAAAPATTLAQTAPNLSKDQRQTLLTLVNAVKASAEQPATDEGWQVHLLRASDGSHYVAFSADAPGELTEDTPLAVYVRLALRATEPPSVIAQRSAVEEWLLGQRKDPLPMQARRVVQIPSGELPVGGPLSMSGRDTAGQSSAALALVERERTREKAAAAAREQERRDELEGRAKNLQDLLPFEDFDMAAKVVARPGRTPVIRRALTSGPGEYDVAIGWAVLDGKGRPIKTGVLKHAITLRSRRRRPASRSAASSSPRAFRCGTASIAPTSRPRTPMRSATPRSNPPPISFHERREAVGRVPGDQRHALAHRQAGCEHRLPRCSA